MLSDGQSSKLAKLKQRFAMRRPRKEKHDTDLCDQQLPRKQWVRY